MAKKKRKKKKLSRQAQSLLAFAMMASIIFLPTTILLLIGMMPTIVILLFDRVHGKIKAMTVGALNLAGCTYFLLELWVGGQSIQKVISIISDPNAIVMMYATAAVGYMIDWAMSQMVAGVLYQRGVARQEAIAKRQSELIARWGDEVTGIYTLDPHGFPIDKPH
jgi:hypothetical protein